MNAEERSEPKAERPLDTGAASAEAEQAEAKSPTRTFSPPGRGGLSRRLTSLLRNRTNAGTQSKNKAAAGATDAADNAGENTLAQVSAEAPELPPVGTAHEATTDSELVIVNPDPAVEDAKKISSVETPTGEATLLAETATVSPISKLTDTASAAATKSDTVTAAIDDLKEGVAEAKKA